MGNDASRLSSRALGPLRPGAPSTAARGQLAESLGRPAATVIDLLCTYTLIARFQGLASSARSRGRERAVRDPRNAPRTNARRDRSVPVNHAGRRLVAPEWHRASRLRGRFRIRKTIGKGRQAENVGLKLSQRILCATSDKPHHRDCPCAKRKLHLNTDATSAPKALPIKAPPR